MFNAESTMSLEILPQYRAFYAERENMLNAGDYEGYLSRFGSHERLEPFLEIVPRLSPKQYGKLLRDVYTGIEVTHENRDIWASLFHRPCLRPKYLMSPDELNALKKLPPTIRIWRGYGCKGGERGFSWTLDKKVAEFFADYSCGGRRRMLTNSVGETPYIAEGTCQKSKVLALFTERQESEIFVDPKHVKILQTRRVPPVPDSQEKLD
jgi:hypothetical protein